MARRIRKTTPTFTLPKFLQKPEFRADSLGTGFLQKLYFTRQQRLTLLRWGSYAMLCITALVLQDTIFSRFTIFGAHTDLAVAAMLLIAVLEGTEPGSIHPHRLHPLLFLRLRPRALRRGAAHGAGHLRQPVPPGLLAPLPGLHIAVRGACRHGL